MILRFATAFVIVALSFQFSAAQDIPLTIDSSQSSVDIIIAGITETSALSGDAQINLVPVPFPEPFGTAQITSLNMVLDDGFFFSLFFGFVTAEALPGDVSLEMITAGAPGDVDGSNQFDQLMNEAAFAGEVDVFDATGLAGGTRIIDLSALDPAMFDMNDVQLAVDGAALTVTVEFSVTAPLDGGLTLFVDGTIVSTGELPDLIDVTPDSVLVTRGDFVSGGVAELSASDNMDFSLNRSNTDLQSRTEFEIKGLSSTATPTSFEFALEGSVFARGNVVQTIELFDYVAGTWELVDTTNAARAPMPDKVVTVAATGDLSRFVETGTMCIEARVRYKSDRNRQKFASNTDQAIWMIGN